MAKVPKVPRKYVTGIAESTAAKRKAEIRKRTRGKVSYEPLAGDSKKSNKKSTHTQKATRTGLRGKILDKMTKLKGPQRDRFIRAAASVKGIPSDIIRQVYKRGERAWAVGHRVGATQAAWARARVYSFLTGGKTTTTGDADLYRRMNKYLRNKRT